MDILIQEDCIARNPRGVMTNAEEMRYASEQYQQDALSDDKDNTDIRRVNRKVSTFFHQDH